MSSVPSASLFSGDTFAREILGDFAGNTSGNVSWGCFLKSAELFKSAWRNY